MANTTTDRATTDFLRRLSAQHKGEIPRAKRSKRDNFFAMQRGGFDGAKRDRLTQDWMPGTLSPNAIHRADGVVLRDRARDLVINNPLAQSAVDSYVSNVIECGIAPKPAFPDRDQRQLWKDAWSHWGGLTPHGGREADITGQQTIYELAALWLEEIIVGGGCLLHFVELNRRNRRLPLALELLPEERFADDLDMPFPGRAGRNAKTANPVRRGIELDPATGATVAYWIRPSHPNEIDQPIDFTPIRLPAEDCEYAFFKRRIGQSRGHTLLHAAVMWLWRLGYFLDNEMINSAVRSCFSAFVTTDDEGAYPDLVDDDPDSASIDALGNLMEKLQPGMIFRGRPGEDIKGIGPNTPAGNAEPWIMLIERSIGIGMNLSYEELARDFSKGNFSSTRASANSDRKRFRRMQRFAINHFCGPVYYRFGNAAVRAGRDGFPTPADFLADIDEWLRVEWQPPGWASVQPKEDVAAAVEEIANGLSTRAAYIGAKGGDWEEVDDQLEREQESKETHGLMFQSDIMLAQTQGTPENEEIEEDDDAAA